MNKANKRAAKQARYNEKKRLEKERQTKSTNRKRKQRIYKSLQRKKLNQQQNGTKNDSETNSHDVESGSTGTKRDSETKSHDVENDVESDSETSPDNTNESFYLQRVAKYFDQDSNDKSESNKVLYYGTITSLKPVKSDIGILLWHVQYDDDDSEDLNKEELMEAIDLYKSKLDT